MTNRGKPLPMQAKRGIDWPFIATVGVVTFLFTLAGALIGKAIVRWIM